MAVFIQSGCSATHHRQQTDARVAAIIADKQHAGLGHAEAFAVVAPADLLRQRLLLEQKLPIAGPASLGSGHLPPVPHWPEAQPAAAGPARASQAPVAAEVSLSLIEALQIAARNSREYQRRKEELFRSALALDFERSAFRTTLPGQLPGTTCRIAAIPVPAASLKAASRRLLPARPGCSAAVSA